MQFGLAHLLSSLPAHGSRVASSHAFAQAGDAIAVVLIPYARWLDTRTMVMPARTEPLARTIDAAKQYAVSSALDRVVDAELVRGV